MSYVPVTVERLTNYIKGMLEGDEHLKKVYVCGEISNFKLHSSGHCYFSLKDEAAVINAVMFRSDAAKLDFRPESGMKVVALGRIGLFPKSGQYQLYVAKMQPDGVGDLYAAFEKLKEKLYKEGLFDLKYKKKLPEYPKRIALVTSPTGAAVRDMIRIIKSRYKAAEIIVCPVIVQGEAGAPSIASMLDYINEHQLCDVIICGRGGGSMEDLWCFNEEIVARAIFRNEIPVISAVGHEPDVTIADYVADVRAATPSNGAEIVVPDSRDILVRLGDIKGKLSTLESKKIEYYRERLRLLSENRFMRSPDAYLTDKKMLLAAEEEKMGRAMEKILHQKKMIYGKAASTLDAISPLKVIARGYGMVEKDGGIVKSIEDVNIGDEIVTRLSDGNIVSVVRNKEV